MIDKLQIIPHPPKPVPLYLSVDYKLVISHLKIDEEEIKKYNTGRLNVLFNYYKFKNPHMDNWILGKLIISKESVPEKEVFFLISEYEKILELDKILERNFGHCNYNERIKESPIYSSKSIYIEKTAIYNSISPIIKEFKFYPEEIIPMNKKEKSPLDHAYFYDMFAYILVLPKLREKIQRLRKNIKKERDNFYPHRQFLIHPASIQIDY